VSEADVYLVCFVPKSEEWVSTGLKQVGWERSHAEKLPGSSFQGHEVHAELLTQGCPLPAIGWREQSSCGGFGRWRVTVTAAPWLSITPREQIPSYLNPSGVGHLGNAEGWG